MIFTHESVTAIQEETARSGALGIVTDFIDAFPGVRTRETLPEAHRWVNDAFKPANEACLFAFSLNHLQGRKLEDLLKQEAEVKVKADIKSKLYDGSIAVVTGLIPGQTDEEILVLGHLYEIGALTRETSFYETIGGDNHCADPLIGIQCSSLWMHPSRHWHTSFYVSVCVT